MKTLFKKVLVCLMASLLIGGGMAVTSEALAKSHTTKASQQTKKASKKHASKTNKKVKKHKKSKKA